MSASSLEAPMVIAGFVMCSSLALALSVFVPFHVYLVSKGRTTIEMFEFTDPRRVSFAEQYDLGCGRNWRQVFGESWWTWPFPIRASVPGDGLAFPVASELRMRSQYERLTATQTDAQPRSATTGGVDRVTLDSLDDII